jgi:hypothetical protein
MTIVLIVHPLMPFLSPEFLQAGHRQLTMRTDAAICNGFSIKWLALCKQAGQSFFASVYRK